MHEICDDWVIAHHWNSYNNDIPLSYRRESQFVLTPTIVLQYNGELHGELKFSYNLKILFPKSNVCNFWTLFYKVLMDQIMLKSLKNFK